MRFSGIWHSILSDIRYAGRTLRKSPAFVAVAVLSIALGVGANTAIFTLVDQVLLRQRALLSHPLQPRWVAEALLIEYRKLFARGQVN